MDGAGPSCTSTFHFDSISISSRFLFASIAMSLRSRFDFTSISLIHHEHRRADVVSILASNTKRRMPNDVSSYTIDRL